MAHSYECVKWISFSFFAIIVKPGFWNQIVPFFFFFFFSNSFDMEKILWLSKL